MDSQSRSSNSRVRSRSRGRPAREMDEQREVKRRSARALRGRHWSWTINASPANDFEGWEGSWDDEWSAKVEERVILYLVYGREEGEEGTKHLQGHVYFRNKVSLRVAKEHLNCNWVHMELSRTPKASITYCKKVDTKPLVELASAGYDAVKEFGTAPSQGCRSDLAEQLGPLLSGGQSKADFIEKHPDVFCRYRQGVLAIAAIGSEKKIPNVREVQVKIWFGAPGTGKSFKAQELESKFSPLEFTNRNIWFDGYGGEEVLILDEFADSGSGAKVKANILKRYLEGYRLKVPVKGGNATAAWTTVILISNTSPLHWGYTGVDFEAVVDRVTEVLEYTAPAQHYARRERWQHSNVSKLKFELCPDGVFALVNE